MNMLKPDTPVSSAPKASDTVPDPIRIANPTDPDAVVASRARADEVFRNRRGRDRTSLASRDAGGSTTPYSRTTLG